MNFILFLVYLCRLKCKVGPLILHLMMTLAQVIQMIEITHLQTQLFSFLSQTNILMEVIQPIMRWLLAMNTHTSPQIL